jgi:hypothetical protein
MLLGSKKIRLIAISAVGLLAALLFAVRYGPQFVIYFRIRSAIPGADSTGHLSATPRALLKLDKDFANGTSLSYFVPVRRIQITVSRFLRDLADRRCPAI